MAADPLQHVVAGQPLEIGADAYNAWCDAAKRDRLRRFDARGGPIGRDLNSSLTVLIRNDTGSNLDAFSVLRITGVVFSTGPVDKPFEFVAMPLMTGATPNDADNPIAILSEPIPEDGIGRAVIQGMVLVDVLINDVAHEYAIPIASDRTKLESADAGPARILWKESSGSTRRCAVRLDETLSVTVENTYSGSITTGDDKANEFLSQGAIYLNDATAVEDPTGTTTWTIDDASATDDGIVSIDAQIFAGEKTFAAAIIFDKNATGTSYASPYFGTLVAKATAGAMAVYAGLTGSPSGMHANADMAGVGIGPNNSGLPPGPTAFEYLRVTAKNWPSGGLSQTDNETRHLAVAITCPSINLDPQSRPTRANSAYTDLKNFLMCGPVVYGTEAADSSTRYGQFRIENYEYETPSGTESYRSSDLWFSRYAISGNEKATLLIENRSDGGAGLIAFRNWSYSGSWSSTTKIGQSGTFAGMEFHGGVLVGTSNLVVSPPAHDTSTGSAGQIAYDSTYFYICIATNTWRRIAHASGW